MALKGKPVAIGNTATTIYTCPATKEAAVHGLLFGNNTASALAVDVIVYNQATGSDVTVVTDLAVPANGVATWSKPINLNAGDAVKAISSAASGMVCLYSTYEDGATPVASGFTARGVWSSASSYVANDIVSVTGSGTYVAIQASTNQDPTTETAYWMYLEGISASALPAQSGNAGKYLTTDGTDASWGELVLAGGGTDTTAASADITLTAISDQVQKISFNASGFKVNLPAATTMEEGAVKFIIHNKGKYAFTLLNNSGVSQQIVNPGQKSEVMLLDNSTTAGVWETSVTYDNTALRQVATGDFYINSYNINPSSFNIGVVSANKVVCIYNYRHPTSGSSNSLTWTGIVAGRIGTISDDGEISWGSETVIYSHANNLIDYANLGMGIDGYGVVFFRYYNGTDSNIKYVMLDCTGSTISVGSENNYHTATGSSAAYVTSIEMMPGTNTGNLVWRDVGGDFFRQSGFTLGTNTISIGASVQKTTDAGYGIIVNAPFSDTSGTALVVDDYQTNNSHYARIRMSSQSGTTISQGSNTSYYRMVDAYAGVNGKVTAIDSNHALLHMDPYGRYNMAPSAYYVIEWTGSGTSASFNTASDGSDIWIGQASFSVAQGSFRALGSKQDGGRHTTVHSLDLSNGEIIIHEANDNNTATLSRVRWDNTAKELVKIGEVTIPGGNPVSNTTESFSHIVRKLPGVNKIIVAHPEAVTFNSSQNIKFSVIEYGE
jgi:hypothetical protein